MAHSPALGTILINSSMEAERVVQEENQNAAAQPGSVAPAPVEVNSSMLVLSMLPVDSGARKRAASAFLRVLVAENKGRHV